MIICLNILVNLMIVIDSNLIYYLRFFWEAFFCILIWKTEVILYTLYGQLLSFRWFMLGSRMKIVLLSAFFTFAFAMLFLALLQNNVHASGTVAYQLVSTFWSEYTTPGFDFDDDASLQKYLNADHPFLDSSYVPSDLVPIDSNFTANVSKTFKLRQEAALAFADMAWHFRDAFSGDRLYISSAYRSAWFQDFLIKQWCKLIKCAQMGTSEHQAGLAVDLKIITRWWTSHSLDITSNPNKYYDWLKSHAATFGFHNTYQKGIDVDGKIVEWWHWRYVWSSLATLLADKEQTFAEYYNTIHNEVSK